MPAKMPLRLGAPESSAELPSCQPADKFKIPRADCAVARAVQSPVLLIRIRAASNDLWLDEIWYVELRPVDGLVKRGGRHRSIWKIRNEEGCAMVSPK
jgi:hypothetical protein